MGQEFIIKSQDIEDKINQLLPSQAGFQPGVDFSASTTVIPIVDLTETAEGSTLRQDLQTSYSLTNTTENNATNSTVTCVNTPGFYRCFGNAQMNSGTLTSLILTDGTTSKNVVLYFSPSGSAINEQFDFIIKLEAGERLDAFSNNLGARLQISTRQIADVNGNLINP